MRSCEELGEGARRVIRLFQLSGQHDLTFRLSPHTEMKAYHKTGNEGNIYFRKTTFN